MEASASRSAAAGALSSLADPVQFLKMGHGQGDFPHERVFDVDVLIGLPLGLGGRWKRKQHQEDPDQNANPHVPQFSFRFLSSSTLSDYREL